MAPTPEQYIYWWFPNCVRWYIQSEQCSGFTERSVCRKGQQCPSEVTLFIAFQFLFRKISPSASHVSQQQFDQPKCHPGTRIAACKRIQDWILWKTDVELPVMWHYGAAGAGKTAIAHTIASWCAEKRVLLSSFFFWRSDPTRNTLQHFIATLAYNVAILVPTARTFIERAVEMDPNIFSCRHDIQLVRLVLEPLEFARTSGTLPHVIVIDGLDECQDTAEQKSLLQIFASVLRNQKPAWKILICSRAELAISNAFDNAPLMNISTRISLDESEDRFSDIRLYLVDEINRIKKTHPLKKFIPAAWPRVSEVNELVEKSSGQFIYAKTVIKYLQTEYCNPRDQLNIILGIKISSDLPFAELDALYTHILSTTRVANAEISCRLIALCMSYKKYLFRFVNHPEKIAIRAIKEILQKDQEELFLILSDLGPLLFFDTSVFWPEFHHASLEDFLFDPRRSRHLHVDRKTLNSEILCYHLQHMMDSMCISIFLTYN